MGNIPLELSIEELRELQKRGRSRTLPAGEVRRCQMILLLSEGFSYVDIKRRLGCNPATVSLWKRRFLEDRLPGLKSRHRGQRPSVRTPRLEARILRWTLRKPPDGSTHWSTRKLARKLKANHSLVARVWKRAGLKPHRLDRYMASNDPDFEIKAADIIGLYLNPPQHAAVFCVDEKTAIQALDRRDRRLPLSPGRAERHGFEYRRHGTLSLLAAFETHSGQVIGKAVARHTSEQFVSFLQDLLHRVDADRKVHVILDNLSTHKTHRVWRFLDDNPRVPLHFTPTYSSWLNQVELWFGKIQRDVISRGIFTSVPDLRRKLMHYIKHHNKNPTPVKWAYCDPTKRIKPTSQITDTVH